VGVGGPTKETVETATTAMTTRFAAIGALHSTTTTRKNAAKVRGAAVGGEATADAPLPRTRQPSLNGDAPLKMKSLSVRAAEECGLQESARGDARAGAEAGAKPIGTMELATPILPC
jgi:hypothetical protein